MKIQKTHENDKIHLKRHMFTSSSHLLVINRFYLLQLPVKMGKRAKKCKTTVFSLAVNQSARNSNTNS